MSVEGTPPSGTGRWAGLRSGLVEPSYTALLVAAVVASACFAALLGFARPDRLIPVHAYLAENERDDRPFVTADVMNAVQNGGMAPHVAILGASGTREAVSRPDAAALIIEAAGVPVDVLHLTTGGQTTWEVLALVDALWPVLDGVLVVGVGPTLFSAEPAEVRDLVRTPRFGFASPAIDAEASRLGFDVPLRTGVYLWDQRSYFLSRMRIARSRVLRGPVQADPHRFDELPPPSDELWERIEDRFPQRIASYERNVAYHAELLGGLIRRMSERPGVRVLLVEAPINPASLESPLVRRWYGTHIERMSAWSRAWGVPYERLDEEAGLTAADFHDITHIASPAARSRYTRVLVDRIVRELGECL
jgi:hypothetical protein